MKAFWSPSLGAIASFSTNADFTIQEVAQWADTPPMHFHSVTMVDDWVRVDQSDIDSIPSRQRTHLATTLAQAILGDISASTTESALAEIEELLEAGANIERLTSALCIAPLRESSRASNIAKLAASTQRFASAGVFSTVSENQPHIRRLSDAWLSMSAGAIANSGFSPQQLWRALIDTSAVLKVLDAVGKRDYRSLVLAWNPILLYLDVRAAGRRMALARIGQELAEKLGLQTGKRRSSATTSEPIETLESAHQRSVAQTNRGSASERRDRALTQVDAIIEQVSRGNDLRAQKFLNELIRDQEDQTEHLVKSLCNIAQRCKEIFRHDFERECLLRARGLAPNDPWTLIQWGSYLKDIRAFSDARDAFLLAKVSSDDLTPDRCLADLLAAEDRFEESLAAYKSIPNWDQVEHIGTAVADLLRRMGRLDEALMQYDHVLRHWPLSHRAQAGIAEVHQIRGNQPRALELYSKLAVENQGSPDEIYYLLKQGSIQRRLGKIADALRTAESATRRWPFSPLARYLRNSILIMSNRFGDLDRDLPEASKIPGFAEWQRSFNRGLMLLCTNQLSAARDELIKGVASVGAITSENGILAMAAAHALLQERRFVEARSMIQKTADLDLKDEQLVHLRLILQLHVAAMLNDEAESQRLRDEIANSGQMDLTHAAQELAQNNLSAVNSCELVLFARCG